MTPPAHILLINVHFDPDIYGGATIVASQVARRLKARGTRITAVAAMTSPTLAPYAVVRSHRDGIDTYRINLPPGPAHSTVHEDPEACRRLMQLVAQIKPDLAHLHCLQGLGADMIPALSQIGIPTILSVHDFWWICEKQFMFRPNGTYCAQDPVQLPDCVGCVANLADTRKRREMLFNAVARADLVTFPSEFARSLNCRSGLPVKRGEVWANGVTAPGPDFFDMQADRRSRDPQLTFGYVGGPAAVKGWPLVRDAFKSLDREDFRGIVVDGAITGNWWRPSMLRSMKGTWQIHPRYDQAEGIDRFFAEIDVLLFVSQWREAFGLVVREAASRGIRIIQTEGGGAAEHAGQSRTLPIGADPENLSILIGEELQNPGNHPDPVPCHGYDDQTDAFLRLVETL